MAFQIVLGRDATESLFNEKFPNFFDVLNDFGIAYLGSSNLADPAKTFATVSISKLHIKLFFRKNVRGNLSGFVALNYTRSSPLKREDAT